jgi:hypothetical protein
VHPLGSMNTQLRTLLVGARVASQGQIEQAVALARATQTTCVEHLLTAGIVDEEQLLVVITRAFCVPRCDLRRLANLPAEVIACIPRELALEHRVVPLWSEPDGYLRVAMLDPSDPVACEELQFFLGRPVLREIGAASAVAWALYHYYGASAEDLRWGVRRAAPSEAVQAAG